jgi:protease-4
MGRRKRKMSKKIWFALTIVIVILGLIGARVALRGYNGAASGNGVALINVKGYIGSGMDFRRTMRNLETCKKDPNIRAIVLRIDSPGGEVVPAQEIYHFIKEINKPTVASFGGVAASGGYYIACACDKIIAASGSITGSISVLMELLNLTGLTEKIGVKYEVIKSREHKDIGSPFREITEEERKILGDLVDDVYAQFVDAVVEGRNLPRDEILQIADGRVFSGRQAKNIGLIDDTGTLQDAVNEAANLAGIEGEPEIVKFREFFTLPLRRLLGFKDNRIKLEYIM